MEMPDLTPAMPRPRVGGWTPLRQAGFIADLASGHIVRDACARFEMSTRGVYPLCRHPSAAEFTLARDAGRTRLLETAIDRALNGDVNPVF